MRNMQIYMCIQMEILDMQTLSQARAMLEPYLRCLLMFQQPQGDYTGHGCDGSKSSLWIVNELAFR